MGRIVCPLHIWFAWLLLKSRRPSGSAPSSRRTITHRARSLTHELIAPAGAVLSMLSFFTGCSLPSMVV